ncbi:MAG: hypothetical protein IPM14_07080 [bacterium]|nr:hypothetical protein [bacterium]
MGNSFTSLSNDFSGVLFNPAGLGLIKKSELSVAMNLNSLNNQATFLNSSTGINKSSVSFNQFGLVYAIPTVKGSWVFALGYNNTKDFNSTLEFAGFNSANNSMIQTLTGVYNDQVPITNEVKLAYEVRDPLTNNYLYDTTLINGFLNQSGRIKKEGNIGKWSFASSMEFAKGFFLGGTFNIVSGSYKSSRDYWENDINNIYTSDIQLVPDDNTTRDFQSFYFNDIIDWDLSGWDAQLGLLYNWRDFFRFGASVKFPSYINVKETYYVNARSTFGTGSEYSMETPINDPIEYEVKTPFEYAVGASTSFAIFTFSGDVRIIDYTQMEFTKGFDSNYRIERQNEIDELFRTTINYYAGGEIKIPYLPIYGRAGAMYLQSPYNNDPADFDKKYITLGGGIIFDDVFGIEAAYSRGWWTDFSDNYGTNVSRTYQDITVENVIVTLSARF